MSAGVMYSLLFVKFGRYKFTDVYYTRKGFNFTKLLQEFCKEGVT